MQLLCGNPSHLHNRVMQKLYLQPLADFHVLLEANSKARQLSCVEKAHEHGDLAVTRQELQVIL